MRTQLVIFWRDSDPPGWWEVFWKPPVQYVIISPLVYKNSFNLIVFTFDDNGHGIVVVRMDVSCIFPPRRWYWIMFLRAHPQSWLLEGIWYSGSGEHTFFLEELVSPLLINLPAIMMNVWHVDLLSMPYCDSLALLGLGISTLSHPREPNLSWRMRGITLHVFLKVSLMYQYFNFLLELITILSMMSLYLMEPAPSFGFKNHHICLGKCSIWMLYKWSTLHQIYSWRVFKGVNLYVALPTFLNADFSFMGRV